MTTFGDRVGTATGRGRPAGGIRIAAASFLLAAFATGCGLPPDARGQGVTGDAVADYLRGRTAIVLGEYDTAAAALTPLAASDDAYLPVLDLAVYSNLLAGDYEAALESARRMSEMRDGSWPHRVVLYSDLVRDGAWEEAVRVIESYGRNLWVDLLAAWAEYGAGDVERAIARLRPHAALLAGPEQVPPAQQHVRYHLGLLELAAGREAEGLEWLRQSRDYAAPGYRAVLESGYRLEGEQLESLYLSAIRNHPEREIYERLLLEEARSRIVDGPIDGVAEALLSISEMTPWVSGANGARVPLHVASELRPDGQEIAYALATRLTGDGKYSEAVRTLREAGFAAREMRLAEADAQLRLGDFDGAIGIYSDLLEGNPEEPWLYYTLAEAHRTNERYAEAEDWYTKSLDSYEGLLDSLAGFGIANAKGDMDLDTWALKGQGRTPLEPQLGPVPELSGDERRKYIRLVSDQLRMEPRLWSAYFGRGVASERVGDWAAAESDLQRALRLSGENPSVANYLGYSWIDQGVRLDEGLALLQEALRRRPDDPYILDSVAWALYRKGEYRKALPLLERALQGAPGIAEIYDHLGDVLWRLGNEEEAAYQWSRALTLSPEEHIRERAERKIRSGLGVADP